MKYLIAFGLAVSAYASSAQQMLDLGTDNQTILFKEVLLNLNGQNVTAYPGYKEGSPYFKENWLPAIVTVSSGKMYSGKQVKLDVMAGRVLFKNEQGVELEVEKGIKQLVLLDSGNRFVFVNSSSLGANGAKESWYQQLDSGTVSLFRQFEKLVTESTPYNSAVAEKSIKTREKYFLLKGHLLIPIKKTKDILEPLGDKPEFVNKFGKEKRAVSEKMLREIVGYYNSLSK